MPDAFDYYMRSLEFDETKRINDQKVKQMALANELARKTMADRVAAEAIANRFNKAQSQGLENRNKFFTDTYDEQLEKASLANQRTVSDIAHQQAQAGHQRFLQNQKKQRQLLDQNRYLGIMSRDAQEKYEGDPVKQAELVRANAQNMGFSPELVQSITPETVGRFSSIPANLTQADAGMTEYQRASLDARAADRAMEKKRIDIALKNQDLLYRSSRGAADEYGKVYGKSQGEKMAGAGDVIKQADYMLGVIDQTTNHPGRLAGTGASGAWVERARDFGIPSEGGDFLALKEQLQGNVFLQAYQQLKGGGQITEIEGTKAENAIARLQTAQTEEGFVQALNDLRDVVILSRERAMNRLQRAPQEIAPEVIAPAGNGYGPQEEPETQKAEPATGVKRIRVDEQGNIIQ